MSGQIIIIALSYKLDNGLLKLSQHGNIELLGKLIINEKKKTNLVFSRGIK